MPTILEPKIWYDRVFRTYIPIIYWIVKFYMNSKVNSNHNDIADLDKDLEPYFKDLEPILSLNAWNCMTNVDYAS